MTRKKILYFFTFVLLAVFVFGSSVDSYAQPKPKKKARRLARSAAKLYNQKRYAEAIVKYEQALEISPYFPRVRFFKGNLHHEQKQYDLAVEELSKALEQGSDPKRVLSVRMESYAALGNFHLAVEDARKVVEFQPNFAYYNAFLGRVLLLSREYPEGIKYLDKAVEMGTRDPNVYYFLAVGYNGMGEFQKQGIAADKALKRGTQYSADSWFLLADSSQKGRKYKDAENAYRNAINSYKNLIETNRGNSQTEQSLYQSYVSLADIYRNMNQFDDAISVAKQGLSLRTSDGDLHISLTWYYSLAGKRNDAITAGKRSVQLAPNQYMAYTNLCRAYNDEAEFFQSKDAFSMAKRSFNKAIVQCKQALKMEPNDGETNYYLGRSYFFLDNTKLSKSYYRKSVNGLTKFTQNNPDYSDGFYLLGNAYFATGKNREAIDAYEKCLKIAPRFARVRYNLGYVYNQVGDKAAARSQLSVLQELDKKLAKRLSNVIGK